MKISLFPLARVRCLSGHLLFGGFSSSILLFSPSQLLYEELSLPQWINSYRNVMRSFVFPNQTHQTCHGVWSKEGKILKGLEFNPFPQQHLCPCFQKVLIPETYPSEFISFQQLPNKLLILKSIRLDFYCLQTKKAPVLSECIITECLPHGIVILGKHVNLHCQAQTVSPSSLETHYLALCLTHDKYSIYTN